MTRLFNETQPIEVQRDLSGTNPQRFKWNGRLHQVETVQQHWRVDTDWWAEGGQVSREYFALTTTSRLFVVIYRDCLQKCWYLSKLYD